MWQRSTRVQGGVQPFDESDRMGSEPPTCVFVRELHKFASAATLLQIVNC